MNKSDARLARSACLSPAAGQTGHECNEFIGLKQLATQEPPIKWLAQRGHCARDLPNADPP